MVTIILLLQRNTKVEAIFFYAREEMEVYGVILKKSQQSGINVHFVLSDCEEGHMNEMD